MPKGDSFTLMQRRFIKFYDGNGTTAARKAGYKKPEVEASRLLKNVNVATAIAAREEKRTKSGIANREDRQRFWSAILNDTTLDLNHRLRASELLAKSEGDFLTKIVGEDGGPITITVQTRIPAPSSPRYVAIQQNQTVKLIGDGNGDKS